MERHQLITKYVNIMTLAELFALAAFALVLLFALIDALAGWRAGRG